MVPGWVGKEEERTVSIEFWFSKRYFWIFSKFMFGIKYTKFKCFYKESLF